MLMDDEVINEEFNSSSNIEKLNIKQESVEDASDLLECNSSDEVSYSI